MRRPVSGTARDGRSAAGHLVASLREQARTRPNEPALFARRQRGSGAGQFRSISWAEYSERVTDFAAACLSLGLPRGGCVAVLAESGVEWAVAALGTMAVGGMVVGLFPALPDEVLVRMIAHSDPGLLLVENAAQWRRLEPLLPALPKLRRIILCETTPTSQPPPSQPPVSRPPLTAPPSTGSPTGAGPAVVSLPDFLQSGIPLRQAALAREEEILLDQVATVLYTSGTVGTPKGVMLTHANLVWTTKSLVALQPITEKDILFSYLPLSHIAAQLVALFVPVLTGACVYFDEQRDRLLTSINEVRPTVMLGLPDFWEQLAAGVQSKLAGLSPVRARVAAWARDAALRSTQYRFEHRAPFGLLAIEEKLAAKAFIGQLKASLGLDRLRLALSSAQPLQRDLLDLFFSIQVPVYEIYGMSESTGPIAANAPSPGQARIGTVGRPLPGTSIRLAADGEVLYQGPNLFAGYLHDPTRTRQALRDGWLHTGDLGEIDADGFVRITARKRDLFQLSSGEHVSPQPIERSLCALPLIAHAVVVGQDRPHVTCLLVLDPAQCVARLKTPPAETHLAALVELPEIKRAVQEHVDRINRKLPEFSRIRHHVLLRTPFTLESGELTPALTLRRSVILEQHAAQIATLSKDT